MKNSLFVTRLNDEVADERGMNMRQLPRNTVRRAIHVNIAIRSFIGSSLGGSEPMPGRSGVQRPGFPTPLPPQADRQLPTTTCEVGEWHRAAVDRAARGQVVAAIGDVKILPDDDDVRRTRTTGNVRSREHIVFRNRSGEDGVDAGYRNADGEDERLIKNSWRRDPWMNRRSYLSISPVIGSIRALCSVTCSSTPGMKPLTMNTARFEHRFCSR